MTLSDFFENQYRPLRLRGKSQETSRLYRFSIRSFSKTLGHEARLDDLNDHSLSLHIQRLMDEGRAASTANKDLAQIGAIWRFAARHKAVSTWPEVHKEIEPDRVPIAWMPDELAKLLKHISQLDGVVGEVPRNVWWSAIIHLAIDTGERIGAIRITRWDWISGEWLKIPAEARKNRRRDMAYRLSDGTQRWLAKLRPYTVGKECFPWPYHPSYIWRCYGKILDGAGLPSGRDSKFHRCRKTVASAVEAAGMDAQKALDHTDRRTTLKYIDPRVKQSQDVSRILQDYLRYGRDGKPPESDNLRIG